MIDTAVNILPIDPKRNWVSGVLGVLPSRLARAIGACSPRLWLPPPVNMEAAAKEDRFSGFVLIAENGLLLDAQRLRRVQAGAGRRRAGQRR